jgi:hypothetical protein
LVCLSYSQYAWSFETTGTSGEFTFKFSTNGTSWTSVTSSGAGLTTGIWYHLAVDKDNSGKIRLYRNGVPVGSATPADSSIYHLPTYELTIGHNTWYGIGSALNGWLDELRITKRKARYHTDAGFTPPTHAFPRGGPL